MIKEEAPRQIRKAVLDDLRSQSLFELVDDAGLLKILPRCRICEVPANRKLLIPKEKGKDGKYLYKYLYVVRRGYVSIKKKSDHLPRGAFLSWRGPDEVIGEIGLLHHNDHVVIIRTTDHCELLELPNSLLTETHEALVVYKSMCELLARKIYDERHRSELLSMKMGPWRVARALVILAKERIPAILANERISVKERKRVWVIPGTLLAVDIAGYIGGQRSVVDDALRTLGEKKIIASNNPNNGKITILDLERLEAESIPPKRTWKARDQGAIVGSHF